MKDIKLGTIITGEAHRDAIHIAIAPVTSEERLYPGQHVALVAGTTDQVQSLRGAEKELGIGIVDPFLKERVEAGEKFFLMLYPQTITSLRHEWTHPAFENDREKSRKWLDDFANRLFSYDPPDSQGTRFECLIHCAEHGGFGTDIEYNEDCQPNDEFWTHFERYTGRKVENRPSGFRCAC